MTAECGLCGVRSDDVRVSLVRWKAPPADVAPFASLPRCRDIAGCRRRVEASGARWAVEDAKRGRVA